MGGVNHDIGATEIVLIVTAEQMMFMVIFDNNIMFLYYVYLEIERDGMGKVFLHAYSHQL